MPITKLTPVWGAQGQPHAHDLVPGRPCTPPRIIVGLLTGDAEDTEKRETPVSPERQRHRR